MVVSIVPVEVFAATNSKLRYISEEYYYDEEGLMYSKYVDKNGFTVDLGESVPVTKASNLPSRWDSREHDLVTPVKDQSCLGTCWAHAFCAAAESSLIAQGYETKDSVDLSEAHLAYFRQYNYVEGSDVPVQQDRCTSAVDTFTRGGNATQAAATVARGSGFALEEDYHYFTYFTDGWNDYTYQERMQYEEKDMFVNNYNLVSSTTFDKNDIDGIKQSIMKYGAVTVSYYGGSNGNDFNKLNGETYRYQNTKTGTNHMVAIVGWDDNIDVSNFKIQPEGDGAWLIKNSYGSATFNEGYLWISYYDTSLKNFTEVIAKPSGDYDNNYQYDGVAVEGGLTMSGSYGIAGANVFTAQKHEYIKSCSFRVFETNSTKCTVTLYTNLTDVTDPRSGTEAETKILTTTRKGYYTVNFDNEYEIQPGEKFAVTVRYQSLTDDVSILPCEHDADTNYSYSYEAGQSFCDYDPDIGWVDVTELGGCGNFPIKVFTLDANEPEDIFTESSLNDNIDLSQKIISGIEPGTKTLNDYSLVNNGYSLEYSAVGTGKEVKILNSAGKVIDTYTQLIFGDVDGDGLCDGADAIIVDLIISNLLTEEQLNAVNITAADCNHDGIIDETDSCLLRNAGLYLAKVNQSA